MRYTNLLLTLTLTLPPSPLPYGTTVRSMDRTGHLSFHVHTTPLATGVSLMPVRRSETYRLSCDRTSAVDSSNDNLKHFCLGLTDHDTLWLFAYLRLKILLLTYLLSFTQTRARVNIFLSRIICDWNRLPRSLQAISLFMYRCSLQCWSLESKLPPSILKLTGLVRCWMPCWRTP